MKCIKALFLQLVYLCDGDGSPVAPNLETAAPTVVFDANAAVK